MTVKLFVALSTFAAHGSEPMEMLRRSGHSFTCNETGRRLTREEVMALVAGSDGVIAGVEPYDDEVLTALPLLKCISRAGVGTDNIALSVAQTRGIEVRNTPNVVIRPVAELTLAFILDLLKRVTRHTVLVRAGKWEKLTGGMLQGKAVGVVGLGRIGREVAVLLSRLGARVLGFDPQADREWAAKNGVQLASIESLLRDSEVVTLHLSPDAAHPFRLGQKELLSMKPGAMLVNVARGNLVDDEALYAALSSGHLAGAALDVFPKEPYSGKLRELDSVLLTPHVATLTAESRLEMEIEATRNLLDYFSPSST